MTPYDCCGECHSLIQCRRRCGLEPEAGAKFPPPASPRREALIGPVGVAVIFGFVVAFGLPIVSLLSA